MRRSAAHMYSLISAFVVCCVDNMACICSHDEKVGNSE